MSSSSSSPRKDCCFSSKLKNWIKLVTHSCCCSPMEQVRLSFKIWLQPRMKVLDSDATS
ncbi:hypothetical protein MTR_3g113640 [Medicago truncatula]|uniref:Uncharacterized protein n=1 Tax=Medicago truncatula TaxID=3880 RepID=A0A072V4H1_MEDTR|nr:hypothetical protein MTR_3g113640 [Medicago truncatula]